MILFWGILLLAGFGLYNIGQQYGVSVINDEFAYWGLGAQMSGKDWTELLGTTGFYSYGYGILLIPLYRMGVPALLMYRLMIGVNVILIIGSLYISVWWARQLFPEKNRKFLTLICLITALYINNIFHMHIAWTESLLYFLFWSITALIYRFWRRQLWRDGLLLAGLSVYLYTVHNRAIGVTVLVFLQILFGVLIALKQKKNRGKILSIFLLMIGLFILASLFRQYTIEHWFAGSTTLAINDYSGNIPKVKRLFSFDGLINFIQSLLGKLYYQATATFLIIMMPIIIAVTRSFQAAARGLRSIVKPQTPQTDKKAAGWDRPAWMLLWVTAAFLIEVIIAALFKSDDVTNLRVTDILYGRYAEFAVGPLLLFGLVMVTEYRQYRREVRAIIILYCLGAFQLLFQLVNARRQFVDSIHIAGLIHFFMGRTNPARTLLIMSVVGLVGFIMIYASGYWPGKRGERSALTGFVIVFVLTGIYWSTFGVIASTEWVNQYEQVVSKNIVAIYEQLKRLNDELTVYYVRGNGDAELGYLKVLQSRLPNMTVYLLEVEDLQEVYEGNYVIMGGISARVNDTLSLKRKLVYRSESMSLYVDNGSEASIILDQP